MSNTNNYITLLAKLGIDTSNKADIQQQIDVFATKLNGINIKINIGPQAIQALEKLANFDFSKLSTSAEKATKQVTESAVRSAKEVDKAYKAANLKLGTGIFTHALTEIDQVKAALAKFHPNVKVNFDVVDGQKNLKKMMASFEKEGVTTQIHFKQEKMSNYGKVSDIWTPSHIQEVHKQTSIATQATAEYINKMELLRHQGKISNQQFKELEKTLRNISQVSDLGKIDKQLNHMLISNQNSIKVSKQLVDKLKEQEAAQTRIINNELRRKSLILDIEKAMKAQQKTLNQTAATDLKALVSQMDTKSPTFATDLKRYALDLKTLRTEATESTRANMGIIESFKIAMTKFPVWMAATTIFYSSIRTAREFMNIIIDIDTKMTSLSKVMSEDTDFEKVFDSATSAAERFGQSISSVLDAYVEFARQGFKGDDLSVLADAGLIAANVGEISAQKASEFLTGTLIQWKMEVAEGKNIIDSWNNISNNYATTLEKLGEGHMRSAAAARAMNLSFDETNAIIATLTAATKQSGNEIGNFLKTALPRLVGGPASKALDSLGVSLANDDGTLRNVIDVYTEVAEKVKGISEVERIAVTEGLAGKYHITRMQVLLDDLGSADSMYRQIYETSTNSAGSADRENAKFMESLQARINLARVEVEKLALAMGEAFITEGLIQALQGFKVFLEMITNVTNAIGALPVILGTVGFAVAIFSTKLRLLAGSIGMTVSAFITAHYASTAFGVGVNTVTTAVMGLSGALRGLLAATGVGIALVVLGVGVEFLLRQMGKSREAQETLAQENNELVRTFTSNRDTISQLTAEFEELSLAMKLDPNLETQKRYYEVQNDLAKLMPSLVDYEDSYGNSILHSNSIINSKIKLLEAQADAEERIQKAKEKSEENEKISQAREDIVDKPKAANKTLAKFNKAVNNEYNYYSDDIKNINDMADAIAHYRNLEADYFEKGSTNISKRMGNIADDLQKRMLEYQTHLADAENASLILAQQTVVDAETVINSHKKMTISAKELASNMLNDFVLAANSGEEIDLFANVFKNESFQKELSAASVKIEEFMSSTNENFLKNQNGLEKYAETLKNTLVNNLKDKDGITLDVNSDEVVNASKAIDDYISKLIISQNEIREYADTHNVSMEDAAAAMLAFNETGENGTSVMGEYVAKITELSSAVEKAAGVSENLVTETNDLIYVFQTLSSVTSMTAEQEAELLIATNKLKALYPHLVKEGELRIDSILAESKAQDILLKATEASKKNLLTAEEEATLKQFNQTNARISLINQNILAIDKLAAAYEQLSNKAKSNYEAAVATGNAMKIESAAKELMRYSAQHEAYKSQLADLATLENNRTVQAGSLLTALDRVEKAQDKTAKSTEKSTKESIYITDKYKQALEAVNAEIEKQQLLRNGMTTYSKEYRASLQQEIKLEQDKKKLLIEQAAALEKQIKSGKVQQTGTITSSSTSKNLNGWDGTITSSFGMRNHPISGVRKMHEGTDIDGVTGQRLDANISGKVIASGNSKQTGYASSYGNIVVVQDDKGVKHIYAHLDKAIAKLGETIVAGMQIGTIGETGSAKGSHLHYETRNASGKAIDSASYVSAAKSGKVSSSSTPSSITTEQQAIDQIQSDLVRIKAEIPKIDNNISSLEVGVINSYLEEFNQKKETYQRILDFENEKIKTLDTSSVRYGATLDRNKNQMAKMQDVNRAQLAFLEKLINSGTLSAETLDTMKISAEKLKIEMEALSNAIYQTPIDKINARMGAHDQEIDDIQFLIDRSKAISGLMDEGSADYNNEIEYQLNLLKQNQTAITNKTNELKKLMRTEKLNIETVKDYKEQLEDLALEYWNLEGVIKDTEASLKDSNDKLAAETADKLISAYKDYISQKRDMHIRSIDDDMKAEDKRHKRVMDNYRDEMDAYQKIIQDKLDSIDREESEYDYAKEMNELEKERLEVLRKINLLSLDQSLEAKAERKGLNEELEKIDDTIATKRRKKEADDRKGNLNEMLEEKREQINKQEKMESEYHEREKERIDDLKEYWDQFYTDQLNDEVKFAKIKADIVAGNFDELSAEFKEYMDEMKATMPELENTLDGTMKAVGLSIRQNIITSLQEAIDKLKEIQDGSSIGNSSYSSSSNSSKANSPPLGAGDAQVLTGKFLFEEVSLQADSPYLKKQIRDKADALAASGRKAGSAISSDVTLKDALAELTDKQKKEFGNYLLSTGVKQVSSPALQKLIRDYGSKLASLNTGGYTGSFSGGKVGILHEEEVILNKKETKDFFKYASVLETLQRLISPLKMSPIRQPELNSLSATPSISLEFHVDKMIANESTAKSLAQTVLSEVQNTLKRERGIR